MKKNIAAFIVGLIFAAGLGISGMTDPQKVAGFLDVFGIWDPSLIFVMVGAIGVHSLFYWRLKRRPRPLFDKDWHIPSKTRIDGPLFLGALIFGAGWGLAGYCPGPALVALGSFQLRPLIFVTGMVMGMLLLALLQRLLRRHAH